MKRTLTSIAAAGVVLGSLVPVAFAATTNHTVAKASAKVNYNHRAVTIGSYKVNVNGIAAKDGTQNTEFLPVWYLQQGLKSMGYTVTWDGNNMILNIQTPTGATVDTTNPVIGTGDMAIQLNGTMVQSAPHMVAKDPASGVYTTYVPVWYLEQVLTRVGFINNYNGAAGTWTEQTNDFAVSGVVTGLSIGTKDALSLTSKTQTVDASKVTWSVDGNGAAVIDANGNFIASAGGTYNVTAKYEGVTATAKVVVYGQAVGYKITANSAGLMADGASYNTVTVTAVDTNGNTVSNYNGKAIVADSASPSLIAAANTAGDQPSDFSISGGVNYIQFTNGVATLAVGPTSTVNLSDTITVTDTSTTAPLTSTTYSFTSATSSLTALNLAVTTGSPAAISANGQYSTNLTLSAENAAGNIFPGQPGTYVTLSLTGPGSFTPGTTPVTSETVYVPTTGTLPVTVYSLPGQQGNVVVSATATGLTAASLTVPTYINTAAGSLSVTSTTGKDSAGNPYTLYTVQLLDTNGHPITTTAANDAFSVSDNSSSGSGVLQYGTVNTSTGVFTQGMTTGFTGNLVDGIATFAVETNTVGTGTPTLTVTDSTNSLTKTATYSYVAGAATKVVVTPSTSVYNVKPGQTVTFKAQLEDANSNPVASASQPVVFNFDTNSVAGIQFPTGQTTYTVNTDSTGAASISFTIPSSSTGGSLKLHAVDGSLTAGDSATITALSATNTSNYATQVAISNATTPLTSITSTAGHGVLGGTINATAENAIGGAVSSSDWFALSSSNTNVVSIPSADATVQGALGVASIANDLVVGSAGSAVITVQDVSNPDAPKTTFTVNVNPGSSTGAVVEYNGALISANNPVSVAAGTPVQLTVVNADTAGDPLPVVGSTPVTVNLATSGIAGDFRLSATGAPVTSVTLQPGQSSVPVYFVSSAAETLNTGSQLTATEQTGVGATGSVTTPGVATVSAVAGVGTLTIGGADTTGGTYTVSINGIDSKTITTPGTDTTAQVATAIAAAYAGDATYNVVVDGTTTNMVDFTQNTATTGAVTPSMAAGTGLGLTGTGANPTAGVTGSAGTAEVYTLTVNSGAVVGNNLTVAFSDGTITKNVTVAVATGDSASVVAGKIAAALTGDTTIGAAYTAVASGSTVVLTQKSNVGNKTITVSVNG